jgi:hypothetical protein
MYDFENSPIVSAFNGYNSPIPYKDVNMLRSLTTEKYKDEVKAYRASENAANKKAIKASLPCMTISGTFERRSESGLIKHSNYICLDIDGKDQLEHNIDWEAKKKLIGETFDCIYYAGLSISGDGIFIIIKVRNPKYHKMHYKALANEVSETTGLKIDMSCCDIARLRSASYDPVPYYNPNPTRYNKVMIGERQSTKSARKSPSDRNKQNMEEAVK